MRLLFFSLMRFAPLPVFSCGMLPSLRQGNSHSVPPLRGFQWRLPHTFSAGISWWLRKIRPLLCQLCRRCRVGFGLPYQFFSLAIFSGSCGLPDVPFPPALRLPPLLGGGKLFERPCLWLSGFLPFAPRLMLCGFFPAVFCKPFRFLRRKLCPGLFNLHKSFMDFFLGGLGGSVALRFSRHSFCHSRLCASRFSSASCSSGVRSPAFSLR